MISSLSGMECTAARKALSSDHILTMLSVPESFAFAFAILINEICQLQGRQIVEVQIEPGEIFNAWYVASDFFFEFFFSIQRTSGIRLLPASNAPYRTTRTNTRGSSDAYFGDDVENWTSSHVSIPAEYYESTMSICGTRVLRALLFVLSTKGQRQVVEMDRRS